MVEEIWRAGNIPVSDPGAWMGHGWNDPGAGIGVHKKTRAQV